MVVHRKYYHNTKFQDNSLTKGVRSISYPRSGHHLLVKFLFKYFLHFNYCVPGIMCECHCPNKFYQNHCKHPDTNFSKSHDLYLELDYNSNFIYIIQCRHPLTAIISSKHTNYGNNNWDNNTCHIFFMKQINFYKKWIKKWIVECPENSKVIHVKYHELIQQPFLTFKKVIEIFSKNKIDDEKLNTTISLLNIQQKNRWKDKMHYATKYREMFEEANLLNLPLI